MASSSMNHASDNETETPAPLSESSIMDNSDGNQTPEHSQQEDATASKQPEFWIPSVMEIKKPKEGMVFGSVEDAFTFYNDYAKEAGFGVRKSSNRVDKKTGEEVFKTYVCYKEGISKKKKCNDTNDREKRRRTTLRENCHALLSVKKNEQGLWVIIKFVEGHSHGLLSPSKTQFLSSHRTVTGPQRKLLKSLNAVNVSTSQTMSLMDLEAGGHEYVGIQVRDLYNTRRDDRETQKGHDAQMLINYFEDQKQKNPAFFYRYEIDSDNCLTRVFWADATCRLNYGYFGDVVVFDTTYKTNKYDMIFAPFTGVNHHYQSIYFGFGFLHDETAESFCWLFRSFLECMPGDAPKSIITDQDPSMAKAIPQIFPNIFHRWCIWHITQKLPNKLGCNLFKGNFASSFHHLIKTVETPEEFEQEWHKLMSLYEFENDKWLMELYEKRHKWVNAYLKHIFFTGMTSSQRSESHHSALKKYLSPQHSFIDFISGLKLVLSKQRTNELQADKESLTGKPKVKTSSQLEEFMAGIYTKHIFYIFQDEFFDSGFGYSWSKDSEDDNEVHYNVTRLLSDNKGRTVIFHKESKYLTCSCHMFEFQGIPCRHLLLMLRNVGINDLPSRYILKRWCKDAKKGAIIDNSGDVITTGNRDPRPSRLRELKYDMDQLAEQGATSEENFEIMKGLVKKFRDEFAALTSGKHNSNEGVNELDRAMPPIESMSTTRIESVSTVEEVTFVNEPSQCRPKGCGKRLKTRMEKIISKTRLCRACGKRGVQHDSRNCPNKMKLMQENEDNDQYLDDEES